MAQQLSNQRIAWFNGKFMPENQVMIPFRDRSWKYAVYLDPSGRVRPEYELYDLDADPDEALNLVDKRTGRGRTDAARRELPRLHALLSDACTASGTLTPQLPALA